MPTLPIHEALSGITGSISVSCWIFLLLPQIYENYSASSAQGLSIAFLITWFIGDVTNLIGAIGAHLVGTAVLLAAYFIFADAALIGQVVFYMVRDRRRATSTSAVDDDAREVDVNENTPLVRTTSYDIPGSRRRSSDVSATERRRRSSHGGLPVIEEEKRAARRQRWKNVAFVMGIFVLGTVGWVVAWLTGVWTADLEDEMYVSFGARVLGGKGADKEEIWPQVLGYVSAACYLGARIPQIIKNRREQSCEGLSLLFFVLSCVGNLTYGMGILFHSLKREYIITNIPWLLGSLGTIVEDGIIFGQFRTYSKKVEEEDESENAVV